MFKKSKVSSSLVTKEKIKKRTVGWKKNCLTMTPFEDLVHLQTLVNYQKRGRKVGAYLLKKNANDSFCFTFGFETQGIHTTMSETEIEALFDIIESGLKDLPFQESLSIHLGVQKSDRHRQNHLDDLIAKAPLNELKFLLLGEKARIKELSSQGLREPKKLYIFVTYHERFQNENYNSDWLEKSLAKVEKYWYQLKGKELKYKKVALQFLLKQAFTDGFLRWEQFLSVKLGLRVKAMSDEQLWSYLWYKFNDSEPIPIPQKLILDDKGVKEEINSNIHLTTLLLKESVPVFDRQWVHLNGRYLGVLTFWDKPGGWKDKAGELKYLWDVVAKDLVTDTEIVCQISPANPSLMRMAVQRLTKQSNVAIEKASKHSNIDVVNSLKTKQSVEAQEKLYSGEVPIYAGISFLVYRRSRERLEEACRYLEQCFHRPAWVVRERDIAWKIWLQTLPITKEFLLSIPFANRRQVYLSGELIGLLPLVKTRDADKEGLELIANDGGSPIFIDLFTQHRNLAIFGTTRSGKSVLVSGILTHALARNIPVVALDYPKPDGTSTFTDYTYYLDKLGGYFDISREALNLFDRPNLSNLDSKLTEERLADYQDFLCGCLLAMVVGESHDELLNQTVRSIIFTALKEFFSSEEIIQRYQKAEAQGMGTSAWENIPTLNDFIPFCSAELKENYFHSQNTPVSSQSLFARAIEQIKLRLTYWRDSRVGKAICRPSTINTEQVKLLVLALRGLSQNEDAAIVSLTAYAAALRKALSNPVSIFFIDESPILFKFPAIANLVGSLCANGAKAGIRVILSAQDPNTIYHSVAGEQIFQNMSTRLTGRIQPSAVQSFAKILSYPLDIISQNQYFTPSKIGFYSNWLLDNNGVFTFVRYYVPFIQLAIVANNPDEQAARQYYLDKFSNKFEAISSFSRYYCERIISEKPLLPIPSEGENNEKNSIIF